MRHYFSLAVLLSLCIFCHSQDVKNDSITYLDEVVIVDPVQNKKATGITPSQVIRGKFLEDHNPIDVVSAINQVSGVYVLSGALNTNRITIRGVGSRTLFGTDKLRLYYNDIPVTNGTGFSTIEAFDLENLEAIEIIKGPKATAFGTNLGGAILLNTPLGEEDFTRLENRFSFGSYGLLKDNLSFSHADGAFSMSLRYGHVRTDGYRENNEFERDGILLNTAYKISKKSSMSLLFNYIDYTAQIPSSISGTAFRENPRQAAFTWRQARGFEANKYTLIGLSHSYEFSENFRNNSSVFYTYLDHYEPRPFNILDEFTNGFGFRTRFNGNFNLGNRKAEYLFGGEFYVDEYRWGTFDNLYEQNNGNGSLLGDRISDNKEFRRQFNGFGSLTLPLSDTFQAQLGLNVNHTAYDFRDRFIIGAGNRSADRSFDTIFLPSLSLVYTPDYRYRIYANVSRVFSNPSLEETLTPDGVINPDIQQETGTNYELGTRFMFWPKTNLWIDVTLYRMEIKNLLVAERVGEDQFIGRNAGETRHQGIELQVDYKLNLSKDFSLSPFLAYTLNDHSFIDFVDDGEDFSGNPLTGVPKHRLNVGFRLRGKHLFWSARYNHVGEIPLTDANSLSSEPFGIFNSRIGYDRDLFEDLSVGLQLGVNNIFDVRFARSVLINAPSFGGREPRFFYPGNNRNYYAGIRLTYNL
ncbi:MAG: TonB-dependent receptor [Bacteroidota bacterium]